MARKLQILMPMGGLGSRFAKVGFATPKPLIPVDGQAMFLHAIHSFDHVEAEKTYTFVIRQEHVDQYQLDQLIKRELPEAQVVIIPEMTRGAAETAFQAYPHLNPDDGLVIMDCDFRFTSPSYDHMLSRSLSGELDIAGGLLTFESQDPRYSYAETDAHNYVLRTAEKQVISPNAIWGAYFFAQAKIFGDATAELLKEPLSDAMKEYYISFVYSRLLAEGRKIMAARVETFDSFGTPEELEAYVGHPVDPV